MQSETSEAATTTDIAGAASATPADIPGSSSEEPTGHTDLNPVALKIDPSELAFINALTPLLGRSPRALKRFINIYRVIKASVPSDDYPAFSKTDGEFPIAVFLLAIVTNAPEIAQPFFSALYQKLADHTLDQPFSTADWQSLSVPASAPPAMR